tara:strand:- start:144 stop:386 length:243 start_codon:yes stop_codon:yes gene_type:complete
MVKALIVMRSVALFFRAVYLYSPNLTQTPNDIFIQKREKNYLLNNLLNGITKILLQKMGYYSSEVQALGSGQQINILVVI